MDNIETFIIKSLKEGLSQPEISVELKKSGIKPNSVSSIEKKLKRIKENFKAKNLFQLACILQNNKYLENMDSRNGE